MGRKGWGEKELDHSLKEASVVQELAAQRGIRTVSTVYTMLGAGG